MLIYPRGRCKDLNQRVYRFGMHNRTGWSALKGFTASANIRNVGISGDKTDEVELKRDLARFVLQPGVFYTAQRDLGVESSPLENQTRDISR